MISLENATINKKYQVKEIPFDNNLALRLLDIGIVPGANIYKIIDNPFGEIAAYLIMGGIIAIRNKDVKGIMVSDV